MWFVINIITQYFSFSNKKRYGFKVNRSAS
ncbi:hypothetical protein CoNPh25_CDS0048 [Staphylococcus phage S-CoN_Ph25]|nr:hypothetical protein CoNPh25_CDS0048 [Staphylococcus phage S-CoN_Ph25]